MPGFKGKTGTSSEGGVIAGNEGGTLPERGGSVDCVSL